MEIFINGTITPLKVFKCSYSLFSF